MVPCMVQSTQRFQDTSSITVDFVNIVNNVGKDIFPLFAKCQIIVRTAKPDIKYFVNWRVITNSLKYICVHASTLFQSLKINQKT